MKRQGISLVCVGMVTTHLNVENVNIRICKFVIAEFARPKVRIQKCE